MIMDSVAMHRSRAIHKAGILGKATISSTFNLMNTAKKYRCRMFVNRYRSGMRLRLAVTVICQP